MKYYDAINRNKEAVVFKLNEIKKKRFEVKDIDWDKTKVIIISQFFDGHQKGAKLNKQVKWLELWQLLKYGKNVILKPYSETAINNYISILNEAIKESIAAHNKCTRNIDKGNLSEEEIEEEYFLQEFYNDVIDELKLNIKLLNTLLD